MTDVILLISRFWKVKDIYIFSHRAKLIINSVLKHVC